MKNRKIAISMTLLAAALIVLAVVGNVHAQSYQTVTTITGSGDQTTNYFDVPSSEFLLNWTYSSSTPTYAAFYVDLYQQGNSIPVDSIIASSDSGVSYEHSMQPGNYYITVNAANLDSYSIIIAAQTTTATPTPTTASTPVTPEFPAAAITLAVLIAVATGVIGIKTKPKKTKIKA